MPGYTTFVGMWLKKPPCFSPVAPRGLRQDLHGWGREEIEEEADRMSKGIKGIRTSAASLRMPGVPHPRLQAPPVLSDKLIPPLDAAASSLSVLPSTEVRARSETRVLLGKQPRAYGQRVQW